MHNIFNLASVHFGKSFRIRDAEIKDYVLMRVKRVLGVRKLTWNDVADDDDFI